MFISNMTHFLDAEGNIAKEMNKQGRELSSFLAMVIDIATKSNSEENIELRCWKKKCNGTIEIQYIPEEFDVIDYWCTECDNAGAISGWQGTKWDNRK
jgi:hypothetical protein